MDLAAYIRDIPDWPKEGVMFKDITPLLADPGAFKYAVDTICEEYRDAGVTKVLGAEARGFIFGAPIAYALDAGFTPARKPGKLPWKTANVEYDLEYGTDQLEIHEDGFDENDTVLIVDDVLATGGTAAAKAQLVREKGAKLAGFAFVLSLDFLGGEAKLPEDAKVIILVHAA